MAFAKSLVVPSDFLTFVEEQSVGHVWEPLCHFFINLSKNAVAHRSFVLVHNKVMTTSLGIEEFSFLNPPAGIFVVDFYWMLFAKCFI